MDLKADGAGGRAAAALRWVRAAASAPAVDAKRRSALLESARAIVGAEALLVCAVDELPRRGGRWFCVELGGERVAAALRPKNARRFSAWQQEFLLHVAETLFRSGTASGGLQDRLDAVEREAILEALRATDDNKSRAARLLGITRGGLYLKIRRHRLT